METVASNFNPLIIQKEEVWKNFDLSVVIPFYKKMKEFRKVFPKNRPYFERNGIEVIIVLDCPNEKEELLEYVKQYPFINWRIILNDKPHEWRNPAKPLNVGIRHATKKYVMVCSPESEFLTDAILILRQSFEDYADTPHYAIGRVCLADENDDINITNFNNVYNIPFGSIMVEKKYIDEIHGYDETFAKWGGDDNNIRARLDMIGVEELYLTNAMLIHRDIDNEEGKVRRADPFVKIPNDALRHFFFPNKAIVNDNDWGKDFDKIIYDWKDNIYAEEQLKEYLKLFPKSNFIKGSNKESIPLLLLVQCYNESKWINDFLNDTAKYFDGVILLDDGSTDNTFEIAHNDKLFLKVKKQRVCFNDLENRNILLDLSSFFKYEIAAFIDVDERIDSRFSDFRTLLSDEQATGYILSFVHLWNDENMYNTEYPITHNGIGFKYRAFRNIGHAHIYSDRGKLHFLPIPTKAKMKVAPILIKHYSTIDAKQRHQKYEFYNIEDTEHSQSCYEHFLNDSAVLDNVINITSNKIVSAFYLLNKISQ